MAAYRRPQQAAFHTSLPSRVLRQAFVAGILAAVAALAACGAAQESPRDVLVEYRRALAAKRWEEAYRLLSDQTRRTTSLADFRTSMESNPQEVEDTIQALSGGTDPGRVSARVRYGLGEEIVLGMEDGRWVIDSRIADFYPQRTPRDALRSFIRAIERRRLDVLQRFVPSEFARSMEESHLEALFDGERAAETEALAQNLRAHVDAPIEVTGERAAMPYGERYTVLFVREDGVWKIEDPD